MNREFVVPPSGGAVGVRSRFRLKAGLPTRCGSWSQGAVIKLWRLPMNREFVVPPSGGAVGVRSRFRLKAGLPTRCGSWSQGAVIKLWRLPMNLKMVSLILNELAGSSSWRVSRSERNKELSMNGERRRPAGRFAGTKGELAGRMPALPVHGVSPLQANPRTHGESADEQRIGECVQAQVGLAILCVPEARTWQV